MKFFFTFFSPFWYLFLLKLLHEHSKWRNAVGPWQSSLFFENFEREEQFNEFMELIAHSHDCGTFWIDLQQFSSPVPTSRINSCLCLKSPSHYISHPSEKSHLFSLTCS
jgi:hypothetical protein